MNDEYQIISLEELLFSFQPAFGKDNYVDYPGIALASWLGCELEKVEFESIDYHFNYRVMTVPSIIAYMYLTNGKEKIKAEVYPRYERSETDKTRIFNNPVTDILVRFYRGFSPLWSGYIIDGRLFRAEGKEINWDILQLEDSDMKDPEHIFPRDNFTTNFYENELLYEAYEGDIDAWKARNF